MSTETNKAIILRMVQQVWNEGRIDLVEEFFEEDYVELIVGQPPRTGYELVRQGVELMRNTFPDFVLSIGEQLGEGDRIATRWTMTGTHQGEFYGIPPTGKQINQSGATFYRLSNGRISEIWLLADTMGLLQQLGVIPTPEAA